MDHRRQFGLVCNRVDLAVGAIELMSQGSFYLSILKKEGVPTGHVFSTEKPDVTKADWDQQEEVSCEPITIHEVPITFPAIMQNFYDMMDVYRRFLPHLMNFAPFAAGSFALSDLTAFVSEHGSKEIDRADVCVYKVAIEKYRTFSIHHNFSIALLAGGKIIASSLLVGMISTFDAMLADLLRACLRRHPEIVINKENSIPTSDLLKFESIAELRENIINEEVENVMRDSHVAQFKFIKSKINFDTKEHISEYSNFIEICERRNLFTHTGGIVSRQYVEVCKNNYCKKDLPILGTLLSVDNLYFKEAIDNVFSMGMKLIYSLWLKIERDDRAGVTSFLNEKCFDLIYGGLFTSAITLLDFALEKPSFPMEERPRKVAIVNRANSVRLTGNKERARQLLSKEDWSAASPEFRISVVAIREDHQTIATEMLRYPTAISKEDYRSWPIFREKNYSSEYKEAFAGAFKSIFGEEFSFAVDRKSVVDDLIGPIAPTSYS